MFSKFISFLKEVDEHTRPPETQADWQICYHCYGKQVQGFEKLDLSMEQFKAIDKAMGSKRRMIVTRTTPFAVVYNTKRLFIKPKLPHVGGNSVGATQGQPMILNGVYVRRDKYEDHQDVDSNDFENGDFSLLRFYPDGRALSVGLRDSDPVRDWDKIKQWFNREQKHPNYPVGNYVIRGEERLTITLETKDGDIVYEGQIVDDILSLKMLSHINTNKLVRLEYKKMDLD